MPVYLVHGFRWPRAGYTGIRAFVTLNNLEDCSSEYIHNESSKAAIRHVFHDQYPHIMRHLEDQHTGRLLEFVEQYDPQDESSDSAACQPYAFVALRVLTIAAGPKAASQTSTRLTTPSKDTDTPVRIFSSSTSAVKDTRERPSTTSSQLTTLGASALCLNVEDAMSAGPDISSQVVEALAELRDKLAEGEKIGWWIVYNGDPERASTDSEASSGSLTETETELESDNEAYSAAASEGEEGLGGGEILEKPANSTLPDILGQPLPTLLPPDLKHLTINRPDKDVASIAKSQSSKDSIEQAAEPAPLKTLPRTEDVSVSRPRSSKFSFPLRRKSSKVSMPEPKNDDVPDTATLKEINKKEGRLYKFFGGRSEKKTT